MGSCNIAIPHLSGAIPHLSVLLYADSAVKCDHPVPPQSHRLDSGSRHTPDRTLGPSGIPRATLTHGGRPASPAAPPNRALSAGPPGAPLAASTATGRVPGSSRVAAGSEHGLLASGGLMQETHQAGRSQRFGPASTTIGLMRHQVGENAGLGTQGPMGGGISTCYRVGLHGFGQGCTADWVSLAYTPSDPAGCRECRVSKARGCVPHGTTH